MLALGSALSDAGCQDEAILRHCVSDQPRKPTTYVISAVGAGGEKDQERVTVKMR